MKLKPLKAKSNVKTPSLLGLIFMVVVVTLPSLFLGDIASAMFLIACITGIIVLALSALIFYLIPRFWPLALLMFLIGIIGPEEIIRQGATYLKSIPLHRTFLAADVVRILLTIAMALTWSRISATKKEKSSRGSSGSKPPPAE